MERGGGCVYVFAGETTVFKVFVADALSPAARELANEVAILKHLTHFAPAAVMPLLCVTSGVSLGYISALPATVLEIRRANGAPIDWPSLPRAGLLRRGEQVLAAVVTVSASLVVHGDISSGNIVVHDDVARLIDTGLSAQIDALSGLSARVAAGGTRGFIAPEIREAWDRGSGRLRLTPAVDVFSTGCVLALAESALRECPPLQQLVAAREKKMLRELMWSLFQLGNTVQSVPSGRPRLTTCGIFLGTISMQSMMGQTLRQSVQPVQSSVTCGMCVFESKVMAV